MNEKKTAKEIIDLIGGYGNVDSLTHCMTRLRFVLKDEKLANTQKIEKIEGVLSIIQQGGQYQVVIGPNVTLVYEQILPLISNDKSQSTEIIKEKKDIKNKNIIENLTSTLSGIFLPVISVLAGSGLIKGLLVLLSVLTIVPIDSGAYIIFNAISDAMFTFFPIILGASTSKYFKGNVWLGAVLGAILVYPGLVALANTSISFFGIPMNIVDYSGSVFPVIIAAFFAAKLEIFLKKVIPEIVKFFVVPALVLVIIVPITLLALVPIITQLTQWLADGIQVIYNFSPILTALVLGGPWILLIMLGLHWAGITVLMIQFSTMGHAPLSGILIASQMAMAGAVIAIAMKSSSKEMKTLSISTSISAIFGVSEPALYGVLVPQKKPLITTIIAASLASVFPAVLGTSSWVSASSPGIFGIFSYLNPAGVDSGFYGAIIATVLGFVLGFVLTFFFGIDSNNINEENIQ